MAATPWGTFPFGQLNSERPAREATKRCEAAVVGVYPSAWHVMWTAPASASRDGRAGGVAALAVDVEPTVFWDGEDDNFGARVAAWKSAVGFREGNGRGDHGYIGPKSPPANGSSGQKVVERYLKPLGISADAAMFTDVYPVFLVKRSGSTARREQGDAIRESYDPIAAEMNRDVCTLPPRIPSSQLPQRAAAEFGGRIVEDLTAAAAPLVITLGEEVWRTFLAIPALDARPPAPTFTDLYGDRYGMTGTIRIGGKTSSWLALVHPGLLKGTPTDVATFDPQKRTVAAWNSLHAQWAERGRVGR